MDLTARNAGEIVVSGSLQEKRVLAQKVFGSNLVLDSEKARGSCVKPLSLLVDSTKTAGVVRIAGLEPIICAFTVSRIVANLRGSRPNHIRRMRCYCKCFRASKTATSPATPLTSTSRFSACQQRIRKRAYLAIWRQRLRRETRCHECGGASEINPKKGTPFYYCAACREKMREWHKLIMRRRRARGLSE